MRYVLGIDSGGTKYLVKACALDGSVLAEHTGDPAAHYRLSRDELLRRIGENIDGCLARFGGRREDCEYLVCGTTGIDAESDREVVTAIYATLPGFRCPTVCVNDAEVALTALTGGTGVVVIAGTGSVAFGRNARGETARSGGWPVCIFGDEGSGTWIGYRALHHLSRWFDDRVPSSALTDRLRDRLGLERREDLMAICMRIERVAWEDPGLAGIVDAAAEDGDPWAVEIIREASAETVALAESVIGKLALDQEPGFKVGAWGSAIVQSGLHFRFYRERLEARHPGVQVLIADVDAATGACRMALAALEGAAPRPGRPPVPADRPSRLTAKPAGPVSRPRARSPARARPPSP